MQVQPLPDFFGHLLVAAALGRQGRRLQYD